MPFKSRAQRRKFAQLLVEGKISDETYEEWNRETGRKHLPERVSRTAKAKKRKASLGLRYKSWANSVGRISSTCSLVRGKKMSSKKSS